MGQAVLVPVAVHDIFNWRFNSVFIDMSVKNIWWSGENVEMTGRNLLNFKKISCNFQETVKRVIGVGQTPCTPICYGVRIDDGGGIVTDGGGGGACCAF